MSINDSFPASAATSEETPNQLLASRGHTLKLFGIVMILLAVGIANSSKQFAAGHLNDSTSMIKADLIMLGMQWLWVLFIYRGMQERGRSILEFLGLGSYTSSKLLGDIAYAIVIFALMYACSFGVDAFLPDQASRSNNPLISSIPSGLFGIALWLCLSISAGICEEIVFRGYLQRQMAMLARHNGLAIVIQAALFGIGHAYEGVNSVVTICLQAMVFGLFAFWRGNIRAGILAHAAWDVLAGFGVI